MGRPLLSGPPAAAAVFGKLRIGAGRLRPGSAVAQDLGDVCEGCCDLPSQGVNGGGGAKLFWWGKGYGARGCARERDMGQVMMSFSWGCEMSVVTV